MRRTRPGPFRGGAAAGPAAAPGDRAHSGVGARRGHDVPFAAAGGHAMAAARVLGGAARHAAFAAGQAAVVAHVAAHELGAAAYAIKAARAAAPQGHGEAAGRMSAVGSTDTSRTRFARSFWTTSGCATRSAGRYSIADQMPATQAPDASRPPSVVAAFGVRLANCREVNPPRWRLKQPEVSHPKYIHRSP